MNISPVHQQSFGGVWQARIKQANISKYLKEYDVLYLYHPCKDESVKGLEAFLKKQIPQSFVHEADQKTLRTKYNNHFSIGQKLDINTKDFDENRELIKMSLPDNYAVDPKDLNEEALFTPNIE